MQHLHRLWRGELPLSEAFWTWAVGIGLVVNVISSLLFLALVSNDRLLLAFIVGYSFSIPYNIAALVGVWRSADRYEGDTSVADAARIAATLGLFLLSVT